MNEDQLPKANRKILKIRRKLENLDTRTKSRVKVYKIAKKINSENLRSPIPQSIQEDFLFEDSKNPNLFLSLSPCHDRFQVLSPTPTILSRDLLTPTNIVGPTDLYYKKVKFSNSPVTARTTKITSGSEKFSKIRSNI